MYRICVVAKCETEIYQPRMVQSGQTGAEKAGTASVSDQRNSKVTPPIAC